MKTQKKVVITIGSQEQENVKESRRTFKDLQRVASDKENLIGRPPLQKDIKVLSDSGKVESKKKKIQMLDKSTQAGQSSITSEDLTSEEPSAEYWKTLAETRGRSLDNSMHEIEKLKDEVHTLKEENRICKEMLDESKHLVEILQEMLSEHDGESQTDNNSSVEESS